MDSQMPSTSQNSGKISTAADWNTNVLKNDIEAETSPLFSAVKNAEAKMANPENRNDNAFHHIP